MLFPSPTDVFMSGSCVRLARNLYLTAKHVVEDYVRRFGTGGREVLCEAWIVHIEPGREYEVWSIEHAWMSPHSDLALLKTKARNDVAAQDRPRPCVGLELSPPAVGERVVGFGFHSGTGVVRIDEAETRHIEVNAIGSATVGEVIELHDEMRDSGRLGFPCYRVNARFDGGMSGGPVFSDRGHVCGIICSSLPPYHEDEEHVSYVATLWPAMAIPVHVDLNGAEVDQAYPLLRLAQMGIIHAAGHENVAIGEALAPGLWKVSYTYQRAS
jgi:hypothetical protein